MKTMESDKDKIQKISTQLKNEILEPAKIEADKIIADAKHKASEIILEAEKKAEKIVQEGKSFVEQEKKLFNSSISQSSSQVIELLRQNIDESLFNQSLESVVNQPLKNPNLIAELINSLVKAIEKEGLKADFAVEVSKNFTAADLNKLLSQEVLNKIKEHSVTIGDFKGGAKLKFLNNKLTLDISDEAVKDLLSRYLRRGFRTILFGEN